jgi:hypothetical protein
MRAAADLRNVLRPAVHRDDHDTEPVRESSYRAVIRASTTRLCSPEKRSVS